MYGTGDRRRSAFTVTCDLSPCGGLIRIIDLSHAAAREIEMIGPGVAKVRIEVIQTPPNVTPAVFGVQVGAFRNKDNAESLRQRMADRYGSGEQVLSVLLRCSGDPYEAAWIDYLNVGLQVFSRSIAGLQYLVDDAFPDRRWDTPLPKAGQSLSCQLLPENLVCFRAREELK